MVIRDILVVLLKVFADWGVLGGVLAGNFLRNTHASGIFSEEP
jgi:hypothetical protein